MEEDEYKSTYNKLADIRCVFEKALLNHLANRQAKCALARHFCLADREAYSCESAESSCKCGEFLKILRENSVFALKLREINGPLAHNQEIRVQAGGLMGLAKLVDDAVATESPAIEDIQGLLAEALSKYGDMNDLPYSEIIQSVGQFQGRRRRQR